MTVGSRANHFHGDFDSNILMAGLLPDLEKQGFLPLEIQTIWDWGFRNSDWFRTNGVFNSNGRSIKPLEGSGRNRDRMNENFRKRYTFFGKL